MRQHGRLWYYQVGSTASACFLLLLMPVGLLQCASLVHLLTVGSPPGVVCLPTSRSDESSAEGACLAKAWMACCAAGGTSSTTLDCTLDMSNVCVTCGGCACFHAPWSFTILFPVPGWCSSHVAGCVDGSSWCAVASDARSARPTPFAGAPARVRTHIEAMEGHRARVACGSVHEGRRTRVSRFVCARPEE